MNAGFKVIITLIILLAGLQAFAFLSVTQIDHESRDTCPIGIGTDCMGSAVGIFHHITVVNDLFIGTIRASVLFLLVGVFFGVFLFLAKRVSAVLGDRLGLYCRKTRTQFGSTRLFYLFIKLFRKGILHPKIF